jgi:hypothetical protein
MFRLVQEAYGTLSNPVLRARYDQGFKAKTEQSKPNSSQYSEPSRNNPPPAPTPPSPEQQAREKARRYAASEQAEERAKAQVLWQKLGEGYRTAGSHWDLSYEKVKRWQDIDRAVISVYALALVILYICTGFYFNSISNNSIGLVIFDLIIFILPTGFCSIIFAFVARACVNAYRSLRYGRRKKY